MNKTTAALPAIRYAFLFRILKDVSKPYVAPNPQLADMRGGRGCKSHKH